MSEFVGAGLAFPLRTDAGGSLALVRGDDEIGESMRLILGTAFGDRPMRPEFGCAVHDFVFDPADSGLAGRVAYEVRASLVRWEPRIDVVDVDVSFDPTEPTTAYITVTWALSDTNDPRNLVFPFYFIPEE
jgi:hypothetical protein